MFKSEEILKTNDCQIYQQVILTHARKPQNKGKTNPVHCQHREENPYCGDVVDLTLVLDEAESKIADIKFEGAGCALCLASADLMAIAIKGKTISQVLLMVEEFREMVAGNTQF
ncbi:SUF system NifU family Fe-S cluster assembly protein [Microcoleus sp. FACHB-68]|nr:SUF system NifU family Fe-S cluster assembly protein [Microcoleus sp. FACHB-68]